ncbi:hypothetical protein [Bifidobacterium sp. SO4]|uniref:hypothetical protein n=1 Tax=Bifidobacterium sp. SO4 TaxID=2809030 RepID=UPI001BDC4E3A|nr:hypothetical protein [Bifidobacterium sp. SO4]MBT1170704.1 hypothetical protein [Bifidobacterium sp. SO4]
MMRWSHRRNEDKSLRTDGTINLGPVSGDLGVRGTEESSSWTEPQAHMNLGPPANRYDTATMEDTARDTRETRSRRRRSGIHLGLPAVLKDRGKAMACVAVLVAFAAGGGTYLVIRSLLPDERHDTRIAGSSATDNDRDRLRWAYAVSCAEDLLARIAASPVAGKVEVGPLEQAKASVMQGDAERLKTLTAQVEEDFHAALDAEAEKVAESIRKTAARSDSLVDAPDSQEHDELVSLVAQWRRVAIARANLESASDVAQRIDGLADVVERQRDAAREQQKKTERAEPVEADPQPSSGQSQPQYAPITPRQPVGPSWSVPGESAMQRLPGKDRSL